MYCVAIGERIVDAKASSIEGILRGNFPFPLLSGEDGKPITADNSKDLEDVCNKFLQEHPGQVLTVRKFFGPSKYLFHVAAYGRYKIGERVIATYDSK